MKTIQELYKEVMASDELKKALLDAAKDGKVMDFLKANGCDATEEELKALFEKKSEDKELTADELDNIAGGESCTKKALDATLSVTTLAYCFEELLRSVIVTEPNTREEEKEGYIC